jgi:hypothetical protein
LSSRARSEKSAVLISCATKVNNRSLLRDDKTRQWLVTLRDLGVLCGEGLVLADG